MDVSQNEDTQTNRLIKFGMRLGVSAALHPFEYAKVLIQVKNEICGHWCFWHGLDENVIGIFSDWLRAHSTATGSNVFWATGSCVAKHFSIR